MTSDDSTEELPVPSASRQRYIRSISVTGLHGKFNYDLPISSKKGRPATVESADLAAVTADRLTLLYGVNGTGKTSVLRLLFHALSPAPNRGHRAALRRTRFSEFKVTLSDSSFVRYMRPNSDEDDGYVGEVRIGRGKALTCPFWRESTVPASHGVEDDEPSMYIQTGRYGLSRGVVQEEALAFADALTKLGVNPVFLEDSRIITSDVLDQQRAPSRARASAREKRTDPDDELRKRRELDVAEALDLVRGYLSQLMFTGTQAGSV
jgi:hypothetical protein